jgi:hypothetical protein
MQKVQFKFSGGMANNHEMNFYEAGRFQYSAARFIYTLEKFRQDGRVVSRLTTTVNADIRIKAPIGGSIVHEALMVALPTISECAIKCSFEAVFAYVWDLILPKSKGPDIALELARTELLREEQRTLQEGQRTTQMQIMSAFASSAIATTSESLRAVSEDSLRTTSEALRILDYVVRQGRGVHTANYHLTTEEIKNVRDEMFSQLKREELIAQNQAALSEINPETERKLAGQLRKTIGDLALPLKSSATNLNIAISGDGVRDVANLDVESAHSITQVIEDELPIIIRGSIKSYDVENGTGKFRYIELNNPISFRVPSASRLTLKTKILDGMERGDILLSAYFVRDAFRNPTNLIIDDVLEDTPTDNT